MYSNIPMYILDNYHHPDELRKITPEALAKVLVKVVNYDYDLCLYEATKLKTYLDNCVPGCSKNDFECTSFALCVHMLKDVIKLVEKCLEDLITLAKKTPYFLILKSIPGVGDKLAVSIIAEIGDISNFVSADKLVAYAGLDPIVYQSGKQTGEHLKITKKGNKRLRTALYLATQVACQKRMKPNKIKDFYNKKSSRIDLYPLKLLISRVRINYCE
jgi:hypothetical protein